MYIKLNIIEYPYFPINIISKEKREKNTLQSIMICTQFIFSLRYIDKKKGNVQIIKARFTNLFRPRFSKTLVLIKSRVPKKDHC